MSMQLQGCDPMADQSPLDLEGKPQELELETRPTSSPSPIVELPVELLRAIFMASIVPSKSAKLPAPFALSHVCTAWRTIAVDYPDLWAYIHVGAQTKVELFEFMWDRGQRAGVKLQLSLLRNGCEEVCGRVAGRIKRDPGCLTQFSVSIQKTYFSTFFTGLLGNLENLRALRVLFRQALAGHQFRGAALIPMQLAPGLREFKLYGIPMPWQCKIFHSGQLTHFAFLWTPTFLSRSGSAFGKWEDMMAFLRRTPSLEKFSYKPLPPVDNPLRDANLEGGRSRVASLLNLKSLAVRACSWGSELSVFLNSITIRPNMHAEDTAISLSCDIIDTDLQQVWSTLNRTIFHSRFAPEEVELGRNGGIKAWALRRGGQERAACFAFTILQGMQGGPRPVLFDEPESSGSHLAFSFSKIVVLILRTPLPLGLAVNFSELKTLEVIDFDEVAGPAILRAFRLNDQDAHDYPFPSLHTIITSDPEIGQPLRGPVQSMYEARLRHIHELIDTLKARNRIAPKSNRLEIEWRFGELPGGEVVGALEDVVCNLVWIHDDLGGAPKHLDGL